MNKKVYLQCSGKLSQLEARLNVNPYLSKGSLPNGVDAKVFLSLQTKGKIPNRKSHPNLYHWYILMKQFSIRTLQIWQEDILNQPEDKLVNEYIQSQLNEAAPKDSSLLENQFQTDISQKNQSLSPPSTLSPHNSIDQHLNILPQEINRGSFSKVTSLNGCSSKFTGIELAPKGQESGLVIECVLEMKERGEDPPMQEFKERLQEEKLKLLSLEGGEQKIRLVFKTEPEQVQKLKDRISQWEQVANVQFRKDKKVSGRAQVKSQKLLSPEEQHFHQ